MTRVIYLVSQLLVCMEFKLKNLIDLYVECIDSVYIREWSLNITISYTCVDKSFYVVNIYMYTA